MESLGCCHINSVCQWSDDESWTVSEVFITVWEGCIGDPELIVVELLLPVWLHLGLPLKVVDFFDSLVDEFGDDITRMGIHCNHTGYLLSHRLGKISLDHLN